MVSSNNSPKITKERNIRGLPHGVSAAEEDALWGDYPALRPGQHRVLLHQFISLEFGLARLLAGWIPACGELEWKLQLPRLLFEHLQHARRLRERAEELPGGGTEIVTPAPLTAFFQAIAPAESGATYVHGLMYQTLPAVAQAYQFYLARCDAIYDAPTIYLLRPIHAAHLELIALGRALLNDHPLPLGSEVSRNRYLEHLATCLKAVDGFQVAFGESAPALPRSPVTEPGGPYPAIRSQDPKMRLRMGFPTDKEGDPTRLTLREIIYHDATEWQVIDPMCEVFYGLEKMPLDFFIDFSRHIWDETRHARMGFRRLRELGYDPFKQFEWSHGTTRVEALPDYFAMLTLVGEACSFTRKKGSIAHFLKAGDPRSAMLPEVDCIDEQLHVGFGHKWATAMQKLVAERELSKEDLARERRSAIIEGILADPTHTDAKETLEKLDPQTRADLVNTFSGFCGAIEFKLDLTVY